MRDEIKRLTGLQTIDQELRFQEQELSKITARVDELQARVEQSSAELERLKQEDREAALARRELERTLAEGEVQIRNKRMRLSLIKNDRELQALSHEVDVLKESNQRLEAELLARMDGGDQKSAGFRNYPRRWRGSGRSLRKLKRRSPARSGSCRRGPRHGAGNAGSWRPKSVPTCASVTRSFSGGAADSRWSRSSRELVRAAGCEFHPSCSTRSRDTKPSTSVPTASASCTTSPTRAKPIGKETEA